MPIMKSTIFLAASFNSYYKKKVIEKIEKFGKSFKNLTNDTVKAFLIDSKKSKFKI